MSSGVKVGVRIRPLQGKERNQSKTQTVKDFDDTSLVFKDKNYTFDHVFPTSITQNDLYVQTAAPMLRSFMEGYNVTIMAYGQTGSGKTYTMGTSDMSQDDEEEQGLIPRFITDLFENLKEQEQQENDGATNSTATDSVSSTVVRAQSSANSRHKAKITVSFLEIYGEDVFDLMPADSSSAAGNGNGRESISMSTHMCSKDRSSLPVREDEKGGVFVQGQSEVHAHSASEALEYLCRGTRNRITASTAMNAGSSRSHAVFTVTLEQFVSSSSGIGIDSMDAGVDRVMSKLTFVDLAGSERLKRTNAEGQRLKEGIQINSGLFNLGQVINALADDQRLKKGTQPAFVPYRNSKLTHLLKDALGGNSQTLFLACVSPAESDEGETYSTLGYARSARNIQNKPIRNMDRTQMELRRLRYTVKAWMIKACGNMFSDSILSNGMTPHRLTGAARLKASPLPASLFSPGTNSGRVGSKEGESERNDAEVISLSYDMDLLNRKDVQEYVNAVNMAILQRLNLDIGNGSYSSGSGGVANTDGLSPKKQTRLSLGVSPVRPLGHIRNRVSHIHHNDLPVGKVAHKIGVSEVDRDEECPLGRRGSVLSNLQIASVESLQSSKDPEETERLVSRMIEMVNKEKEMYGIQLDDEQQEEGEEKIVEMDQQIKEKEVILNKLMSSVKGYGAMKADFEKLLGEIGSLEVERQALELELEQAKREHDRDQQRGAGAPQNSIVVERIKERFLKVKKELDTMREERKKKENAYRLMQRENKQCDTLIKEIERMKTSRVQLVKMQRTAIANYQKKEREVANQVGAMRRIDVKKQQQMNTLKSEIVKKDRVLGHKEREIGRINSKLRACEEHIAQLLRIQNKNRARLEAKNAKSLAPTNPYGLSASEIEHLTSSKAMLDNIVTDRVEMKIMRDTYERKKTALQTLNNELLHEAMQMETLLHQREALGETPPAAIAGVSASESNALHLAELEQVQQQIDQCEVGIDRITRDLDVYNADLDDLSDSLDRPTQGQAQGQGGRQRSNTGHENWEELGREIIAGFSLAQFQSLTWDLLGEQASVKENLRCTQTENDKLQTQNIALSDLLSDAEQALTSMRAEMKQHLEAAESQRVQDVWAVLKASEKVPGDGTSSTNSTDAENVTSTAVSVALQRAQDLERELETLSVNDEQRQKEMEDMSMQISQSKSAIENYRLRERLSSELVAEGNAANIAENEKRFAELNELWGALGDIDEAQREAAIDRMQHARKHVHEALVEDIKNSLECSRVETQALSDDLKYMCLILNRQDVSFKVENNGNTGSIREQLSRLKTLYSSIEGEFSTRAARIIALKEKLLNLVSEMWIDITQLPIPLQGLLRVVMIEADAPELARRLNIEKLTLEESSFTTWENELRGMNLKRAQTTARLVKTREQLLILGTALDIRDESQLRAILAQTPLDDLNSQAVEGAIELLLGNSASNPPGAEPLLAAAERMLLLLESVKINRSQALQLSNRFLNHFRGALNIDISSPNNEDIPVNRDSLTLAIQSSFDVAMQAEAMLPQLRERLLHVLNEVDNSTDENERSVIARNAQIDAVLAASVSSIAASSNKSSVESIFFAQNKPLQSSKEKDKKKLSGSVKDKDKIGENLTPSKIPKVSSAAEKMFSSSISSNSGSLIGTTTGISTNISNFNLSLQVLENMDTLLTELSTVALCTEEPWLRLALHEWAQDWDPKGPRTVNDVGEEIMEGRECVRQAILLHAECIRLETLQSAQRLLISHDEQLMRHILDMEEFEAASKQDRGKILKGSSTALLAEEKYRRNGKKKYETITGHIFSAGSTLQTLIAGAAAGSIEVSVDLSMLSSKAHELLRGKKVLHHERLELMHLHTINHGTRRWSNEGEDDVVVGGGGNDENVAPPPAPVNTAALLTPFNPLLVATQSSSDKMSALPKLAAPVPLSSSTASGSKRGSLNSTSVSASSSSSSASGKPRYSSTGFKSLDYVTSVKSAPVSATSKGV